MIIPYNHPRLKGRRCDIHSDFKPFMDYFVECLELTGCEFVVTSSGREPSDTLKGVVFTPANMSNHYVYCAIDGNVIDEKGGLWNNEHLQNPSGKVLDFIQLVKSKGLRWGGNFKPNAQGKTDAVHFDNGMNVYNPDRWHEIYKELHPVSI